jgi:GT2 family glycosyltransferase
VDVALKSVLVVIVNYKVAKLVEECLAALAPEIRELSGSRAVVVDNASNDGSAEAIETAIRSNGWGEWATFVASTTNIGFAAGNNLGVRRGLELFGTALPDFFFFLNPDTVVRPRAIQLLVAFLESRPDVGIAGGRSEDSDGTPQHCCFRFPSVWNEFASNVKLGLVDRLLRRRIARLPISDEPHPIGWVSGAAMIVRRRVIEQIGLFDEKYFLYYEETDFALRAARAGWSCWHIPQARIVHYVGYSSGVTVRNRPLDRKPKYWFESRRRFFVKNHGGLYAGLADLAAISGIVLGSVRRVLARKPNTDPPCWLGDMVRQSIFFKGARSVT